MICSVSLLAFVATWASALSAQSVDAYKLAEGPFTVHTADDIRIQDKERNKELHAKVYYPKGDGPFPVIVFSHGFGAGKDAFAPVGSHWASHGYISIHPQHADGGSMDRLKSRKINIEADQDDAEDKPEKPVTGFDREKIRERLKSGGFKARGFQSIGGSTDQIANRVRDMSAVIDALDQVEDKIPALKGKLDREKIGVSGHSYGACVSMLIAGATIEADGKTKSFSDPRVKCIVPISASGTGEYGLTKNSWKDCKCPALYITGTKDVRPGHEFEWRKEPFDGSPKGDKYLLIVEGATHFHFGGGPAGMSRFGTGSGMSSVGTATNFVKTSSTAFFDAYLKGEKSAEQYLADGLTKYIGDKATLTKR